MIKFFRNTRKKLNTVNKTANCEKHDFLILVFVFFYIAVATAQNNYFPDAVWQTKKPEELGMNKSLLDSAIIMATKNENSAEKDLRMALLKS